MTDTNEAPQPAKRRRRMAREPQTVTAQEGAAGAPGSEPAPPPARSVTKAGLVLQLLQRPEGSTIDQLTNATGWLPHTTRAALTGLKKKGHAVTSTKAAGEDRVYRVAVG